MQRWTEEAMYQANTPSIAVGNVTDFGRGLRANGGLLWRITLYTLNQGRRLFAGVAALFRQITADPQPNSTYYLGTYVPFLDSTQPPTQKTTDA
jgi:hypothetical protein